MMMETTLDLTAAGGWTDINAMRREADEALRHAMTAWYNLAAHTPPGSARAAAFKVYENLQGVAVVPGLPGNF